MRFFKKVTIGICVFFVILFGAATVATLLDPEADQREKTDISLGLLVLGSPPLALGGWLWRDLHVSHRKRVSAALEARHEAIKTVFYHLVDANQGRVTVFQLAREADLPAEEAQQFLDDRAREFGAQFDVGQNSEVIYLFPAP